jgi:hypothetical protein
MKEAADRKWKDNPGFRPREARGKRVWILLNNGFEPSYDDNPMSPPGWAADTTEWRKDEQYSFAVKAYCLVD